MTMGKASGDSTKRERSEEREEKPERNVKFTWASPQQQQREKKKTKKPKQQLVVLRLKGKTTSFERLGWFFPLTAHWSLFTLFTESVRHIWVSGKKEKREPQNGNGKRKKPKSQRRQRHRHFNLPLWFVAISKYKRKRFKNASHILYS